MQVQNISNSQSARTNFQGKINIIPGDLSYEPAKYVRKAYNVIADTIKSKPYDVFLKQKNGYVQVTAQKEMDYFKNKGIKVELQVPNNADNYIDTVNYLVVKYEMAAHEQSVAYKNQVSRSVIKAWQKFKNIMEHNEGIDV
ncbi:hypothetical protein IAC76_03205 [Spirochaetes bacterium]|uniref:Uncharacterized protein n=1 Tax=Candidatus Scatousia excrementipullorum TaxID=2840936 RepID=A0A9D9GZV2_9BACT|nr:hypothetical protein [Candidatus Scatousia excrementipullorum]